MVTTKSQINPFTINIPQSALDDLQERLKRTRWPNEAPDSGWTMGTNLAYMKDLVGYWQNQYDWRKHEAELNKFNHFKADVDGINIHFIHERGKGSNPTPILLLHGWPDTFYGYHKLIQYLTNPAAYGGDPNLSFDVVVPSNPGQGFSDRQPMAVGGLASLYVTLMTEVLSYKQFVSAEGNGGTRVSQAMTLSNPDALIGIHLTDVGYPMGQEDFSTFSQPELEFAGFIQQWWMKEGAFNMVQSTKPQSLAYGMNDSPAGLAGWLMSFFSIGMTGQEMETRISRDELLTNIMIYWLTETSGSSMRWYYESAHAQPALHSDQRSSVPAGVAHDPHGEPLPREWAERQVNLTHFTVLPSGGHFVAWEEPSLYAKDVQDFVRRLLK